MDDDLLDLKLLQCFSNMLHSNAFEYGKIIVTGDF
jgi:hypothetical protein